MLLGINPENGELVAPTPRAKGITCARCGAKLIAKCGRIKIHHWAHDKLCECDTWYEPETEWHYRWKLLAPWFEVAFGERRADAISPSGRVIELQNSAMSVDEMEAREAFYGRNMVWLINGIESRDRLKVVVGNGAPYLFWINAHCPWMFSKRRVFLDLGISGLEGLCHRKGSLVREQFTQEGGALRQNMTLTEVASPFESKYRLLEISRPKKLKYWTFRAKPWSYEGFVKHIMWDGQHTSAEVRMRFVEWMTHEGAILPV